MPETKATAKTKVTTLTQAATGSSASTQVTGSTGKPTSTVPTTTLPPGPPDAELDAPRLGVDINATVVAAAFTSWDQTRSVQYVQYALKERGFDPGTHDGRVDEATRTAYARYQKSINERATGVPTADSLDNLGFDVIG